MLESGQGVAERQRGVPYNQDRGLYIGRGMC